MFSHISAAVNGLFFTPKGLQIPVILDAAGFAVQIFFVLSGVVLSLKFMQDKDLSGLGGLAVKRIPRLVIPSLVSTIIVYLMLKNNMMYNHAAASLSRNGNVWLGGHYMFEPTVWNMLESLQKAFINGTSDYIAVLWTMHWEIIGSYFIVIFIIVLYPLKQNKMFFCWLFVTALLLLFTPAVAAFCMGLAISYIFADKRNICTALENNRLVKTAALASIPVLCIAVAIFNKIGFFRVGGALKIIAAALAVGSLTFIKTFRAFFSNKLSRFLGKISFPLYITHYPLVFSFTSYLMLRYPSWENDAALTLLLYGLSPAVSIAAACIFYPVEIFSLWFSRRLYSLLRSSAG
jgi:peptidoglycan/LPS O-acetylase OafA/YrhL